MRMHLRDQEGQEPLAGGAVLSHSTTRIGHANLDELTVCVCVLWRWSSADS